MKAIALWNPDKLSNYSYSLGKIKGFVLFIQKEDYVKVDIFVEGLSDGNHGIHIHEKKVEDVLNFDNSDCCDLLGGHFNAGTSNPGSFASSDKKWSLEEPYGTRHGNHTGDMCFNIYSANNVVKYTYYDEKISLIEGKNNCVLDKTVVIHEDEDDRGKLFSTDENKNIESLISGNSGKRICCAQIKKI